MAVAAPGYEPLVTDDYVRDRFMSRKLDDAAVAALEPLRLYYAELASKINSEIEDNRAKSLALTALEESAMWAIKALSLPPSTSQRSRG